MQEPNINNALTVNFGLREVLVVTQWSVAAEYSFAMIVEALAVLTDLVEILEKRENDQYLF